MVDAEATGPVKTFSRTKQDSLILASHVPSLS